MENVDRTLENTETDQFYDAKESQSPSPPQLHDKQKKKRGVTFNVGTVDSDDSDSSNEGSKSQSKGATSSKSKLKVDKNALKKENLTQMILKKKECDRKAHEVVLRLIETDVEKAFLLDNAINISKHHLDDVIEERKLSQMCGWVLCDKPINPERIPKQLYSIRGNKVYDIKERKSFCDGKCYAKSVHFKAQLLTSPLWLRDLEESTSFNVLDDNETNELHGVTVSLSTVNLSDESEEENRLEKDQESTTSSPRMTESNIQ